uniref:Macaca fascicularis brain cDNA, clone: QflA-18270 n=1 Tax=Macaca fascicularis TaxID=9541 RepID=I7GMT5_MACFA|nr:unnamed protein product [Macaca fascicularis]
MRLRCSQFQKLEILLQRTFFHPCQEKGCIFPLGTEQGHLGPGCRELKQ